MTEDYDGRPDPDALLDSILSEEPTREGTLKIFFGYAAGVGKTYAMLDDAREQRRNGADVLVGYVEPHTRPETMALLEGLPVLPPLTVPYRNIALREFDLDAALRRKPELVLVDELAHTNAEGVRNRKRYQDIEELLKAGINVSTTVNVQHIESLNDIVQNITKVQVRETVPDYVFDRADMVKLIDIEPDELLRRLEEGKIYRPERAETAMRNFFTRENLRLLREIAMRKAADRISHVNQSEKRMAGKMASTKLLACIGPSPSSAKCIRWTARTAEAFHAPWVAAYVECLENREVTEEDKKDIRANMDLAEELGGEIVTLNGDTLATVIAGYARMSGITNIVIGKSRNKKTLFNRFDADLEDKLIALIPGIEIHIIPGNLPARAYRKTKRRRVQRPSLSFSWADTLKTLACLTAATLLSFVLRALDIGDQNLVMVYILSVLAASRMTAGYLYGVVASVIGVLAFNFFFTVPYYTFNAIQPGYPITFLIMLLVALVTSAMTVRIKTQAQLALERERRTEVLYEINKKLLVTRGTENITALTNDYLTALFGRSSIFYTQDPATNAAGAFRQAESAPDDAFLLSEDERAVAHWVFLNLKNAGAGTDTLMGAGGFYMPVLAQGKILGVIGLSCRTERLSQSKRLFLQMIASQVAMALERQRLSDEQRRILVDAEKEKMRSNLLRAISHDLRTPLTCISGSSAAILESGDALDKKTRDQLLADIREESQWLIRLVENILSVTRIKDGTASVSKVPEAAEEVAAEAVSRLRKRFPGRKIRVKVPEELLLVPMDATLIVQVLINLLENAVKHSGDGTEVDVVVRKAGNDAVFEVLDNGEGIAERDLPYVFDSGVSERKRSADASRGMGIGLSICMSIIKAHGGKMEAANRSGGGAVFRFTLPLPEEHRHGE
ncbi:two-component system, OmpR family, sensor histidine kinase KdpD [Sporobacter termitidis DSM 10068]|uniref:histidine kinase n=1 Tax=Sporobacter termitidis DSM 10068 TaxID=1123282 RepID=A0A1M5Z7P7_9FIRM|nr:sensor histidine kinase KdpD [Sporobacter termitidis]SHI20269.1 two-component system, OmpR family, sensor histidine kinase KdpD [Sporobacter termitidis DSM 10068]